jgi:hypothetical protein
MALAFSDHPAGRLDQQRRARLAALLRQSIDRLKIGFGEGDVDVGDLGQPVWDLNEKRQRLGIVRIGHHGIERGWLMDRCHRARFLECAADGDAAGKVRKIDAVVAIGVLAQQSDVGRQSSSPPQLDPGLPLDALDRANRNILLGMKDRHDLLCVRKWWWLPVVRKCCQPAARNFRIMARLSMTWMMCLLVRAVN